MVESTAVQAVSRTKLHYFVVMANRIVGLRIAKGRDQNRCRTTIFTFKDLF